MNHDTLIAALIFAVVAFGIVRTLQRWNREMGNGFELRDLFMENGRASKGAVIMLGAFAATTWFFVYYTLTGKMTEGYFGLYSAAWIIPVVAKMLSGAPPAQPPVQPSSP